MQDVELDIDLNAQGRHAGVIRLAHSHDEAGYGTVATPILVLANGAGPTLLLIAGNHGDEYEGQVALSRFVREVDVAQLRGRIIVLPAANAPAALAGRRLSPIDGGNLNRLFGVRQRTPTGLLATLIETELLPLADAVLDFHSGGRSAVYLPSVFVQQAPDPALAARTRALVAAFGAPWCFAKPFDAEERTMLGACGRAGVPYLSTELAGGERLARELATLALDGIARVAAQLGMGLDAPPAAEPVTHLTLPDASAFIYAQADGIFECTRTLGEVLASGELLGWIHHPETPFQPPSPVHVRAGGVFVCVRSIARTRQGDCLGHVGVVEG